MRHGGSALTLDAEPAQRERKGERTLRFLTLATSTALNSSFTASSVLRTLTNSSNAPNALPRSGSSSDFLAVASTRSTSDLLLRLCASAGRAEPVAEAVAGAAGRRKGEAAGKRRGPSRVERPAMDEEERPTSRCEVRRDGNGREVASAPACAHKAVSAIKRTHTESGHAPCFAC